MPISHDQNFKNLIADYPRQSLAFFAGFEEALDPAVKIIPLRQELPKDRLYDHFHELDIPLKLIWPDGRRAAMVFLLEIESRAPRFSIHRLAVYCAQLAHACDTDQVIPVVIFLRRQPRKRTSLRLGTPQQTYMWLQPRIFVFDALNARDHFDSNNIVARITLPCMRQHSLQERVDAHGKALQGLLTLDNDANRHLKYDDFVRYYAPLDEHGQRLYAQHYATEEQQMIDIAEKIRAEGRQQGIEQGIRQARQESLTQQITLRFGAPDDAIAARLQAASSAELKRWSEQFATATTLPEVFRMH